MPACDFLDEAMDSAAGPMAGIVATMASAFSALRWGYGYPFQPDWPTLESQVAFAQLIGPRGLMDDHRVHVGLTLMAPQTHYPLHAHPAIETYLVLSGVARWRVEGAPLEPRPPGSLIFHRSGIGHAMETAQEPLLALYFWRGDLVTSPRYIADPSASDV